MPIVRRTRAEIDKAKLLAELAERPQPSEDEIEAQAIEDGDAWADEELAGAEPIYPPLSPDQVRALRARLGLTQEQFARRFGFTLDTVQQYEQGRRRPSGPASTLLRSSKPIQKRSSVPSGCARPAERHPLARAAVILPAMRPKTALSRP
jgi:putative transcriptional regulator